MQKNLTEGRIIKTMLLFSVPMILGNLLQQVYNIADTVIVGRFLGADALAAVGAAYTLMTFLTSVIIGLCMGSSSVFSISFGAGEEEEMKESMWVSFWMIGAVTAVIYVLVFLFTDPILQILQVPAEVYGLMRGYTRMIFVGIGFTFLYNYFAFLLRAVGNSVVPLGFLAGASLLNIGLDLWFVLGLQRGVTGAAEATVIAQGVAGVGLMLYTMLKMPSLRIGPSQRKFRKVVLKRIGEYSALTCAQQSVMNFGILMIQGLVNSFGTVVMAAFAAAVKIDTVAYMPAQEFGNAFSLFIAQNYGAGKKERIQKGTKGAVGISVAFCLTVSLFIWIFAKALMKIFVDGSQTQILAEGVRYLRIEGSFYWGIGCLFLLYGFYRAIERPGMSLVLTVISLGTRVVLAYVLAPVFGVTAIWWAIPIGWVLADGTGYAYYRKPIKGTMREAERFLVRLSPKGEKSI